MMLVSMSELRRALSTMCSTYFLTDDEVHIYHAAQLLKTCDRDSYVKAVLAANTHAETTTSIPVSPFSDYKLRTKILTELDVLLNRMYAESATVEQPYTITQHARVLKEALQQDLFTPETTADARSVLTAMTAHCKLYPQPVDDPLPASTQEDTIRQHWRIRTLAREDFVAYALTDEPAQCYITTELFHNTPYLRETVPAMIAPRVKPHNAVVIPLNRYLIARQVP